jgi:hypothetical protein
MERGYQRGDGFGSKNGGPEISGGAVVVWAAIDGIAALHPSYELRYRKGVAFSQRF